MAHCKHCGCFIPDGIDTCLSCGKPQIQCEEKQRQEKHSNMMTNLTVKTNLLVLLEEYMALTRTKDNQDAARKTVVLALKAIDAYPDNLDE